MDVGIASQVVDWIDADSEVTYPDGAEDSAYLSLTPAYRTANIPITSISELLALPGMTRALYDRLTPYITALPPGTNTTLNICTASGVVLDSLAPGQQSFSLSPEELAAKRGNGCFPGVAALQACDERGAVGVDCQSRRYHLALFPAAHLDHYWHHTVHLVQSARPQRRGTFRPILRTYGTE